MFPPQTLYIINGASCISTVKHSIRYGSLSVHRQENKLNGWEWKQMLLKEKKGKSKETQKKHSIKIEQEREKAKRKRYTLHCEVWTWVWKGTPQKVTHTRVNDFQRHACESVHCFASQAFSLSQVNWLLRFLTVRPWDPLSSLEPLPVLIKVPKQEGLVVY